MTEVPIASDAIEVSIVMPCLNEAETLGDAASRKAQRRSSTSRHQRRGDRRRQRQHRRLAGDRDRGWARASSSVDGEGLRQRAAWAASPRRAARTSSWATPTTATTSATLEPFVEKLREGYDLVMGNRFAGGIATGRDAARCTGTSAIRCSSRIGRLFFSSPVGDFHCGLRGFRKRRSSGWTCARPAWSSRARWSSRRRCTDLRIAEVPTTLAPGRPRPRRRTCAAGATAGVTCGSCCSTARAGCFSIRGLS